MRNGRRLLRRIALFYNFLEKQRKTRNKKDKCAVLGVVK